MFVAYNNKEFQATEGQTTVKVIMEGKALIFNKKVKLYDSEEDAAKALRKLRNIFQEFPKFFKRNVENLKEMFT
jgi:hypothetical protein